jgi:hypothetical protein
VSVVVAKGQQFFMALLQRLEPCQALVDRDLSHASAFIPMPIASDDDDAIVASGLSMVRDNLCQGEIEMSPSLAK